MTTTTTTSEITKQSPCRCGCKGTDPSHRKTIRRVVQNVVDVAYTAPESGYASVTVKRGQIQMPYGLEDVWMEALVRPDGTYLVGFWQRR